MKPYQYKNKLCPICGKEIDSHNYKMNKKGLKSSKRFDKLDFWDAINDGFRELHELKEELKRLNPSITDETIVYLNWIIDARNMDKKQKG